MTGWSVGFRKEADIAYYLDGIKFKITFNINICKSLIGKDPMDCEILHKMLLTPDYNLSLT